MIAARRSQWGQSLVELAVATPVLLILILGAFDTAVMISDKVIAGAACRQGARLAAEIGGQLTNPTLTTTQVDQDIVRNVLAVAQAMNYSNITFIYIYRPLNADGDYHPGDPYEKFDGTGALITAQGFPLSARNQTPPDESPIGVRLEWVYSPPTGFATFTIVLSEHAVMRASPVLV